MARKLMVLMAFLAVFGQALAAASVAADGALARALAHVQDDAHHHHDGDDLQPGTSADSTFHVHVDGPGTVALPAPAASRTVLAAAQMPRPLNAGALPSPPPDDLLRPPKPAA